MLSISDGLIPLWVYMDSPLLIPIIRLDTKSTYIVFKEASAPFVVVRMQDLLLKSSPGFNKIFKEIKDAGGIHNFLATETPVMLSFIMRDELIRRCGPRDYVSAVEVLKPDLISSVDGWTYEHAVEESADEIGRIQSENEELLKACLIGKERVFGIIKGCTFDQIDLHIKLLKSLGIRRFVFHAADYQRHGDVAMFQRFRSFVYHIHARVPELMLYGFGSQKRLWMFSFADYFASFNYFVVASNGQKYLGSKRVKSDQRFGEGLLLENYREMLRNVEDLRRQKSLVEAV